MNPVDFELNDAILTISRLLLPKGFDVSNDAPSTFSALCRHLDAEHRMTVYGGGCDNTIYASPQVNQAFRAWHDLCHWTAQSDFSVQGETNVWRMQCQHIKLVYGQTLRTRMWTQLLHAEIVGQRLYYELHKTYLADQRAFVQSFLKNPQAALRLQVPSSAMVDMLCEGACQ